MAAFKRRGSPYYQIEPTIGGRRLPRMTTGVKDRELAEDMEAALRAIDRMGYRALIDQLERREVTLDEVWQAFLQGREALDALVARKDDPLLVDVIARVRGEITDDRVLTGLAHLERHAPAGARLSWLMDFRNINGFYRAMRRNMAPNSVRRGPHRAVADLLRLTIGRGKMLAIMADVEVPSARDERVVMLWPDEIQRLMRLADEEFRPVLGLALTTGIDRKPLLELRVRHWNEAEGVLIVPDRKQEARQRSLSLEPGMALYVRQLAAGKEPGERLVPVSEHVIRDRWEALRAAIERTDVRWKDLRGVFATYAIWCGWPIRELQHWMGHSTLAMTARYTRRLPAGKRPEPGEIAERMGLGRTHLKIEQGWAS